MVCTDNFSSFTVCAYIPSEKQTDCENAIISSIFPFKAATGDVKLRVDTAPGLSAMINRNSNLFKEAGIILEPGNVKNKNSLAKVDKTMVELRSILRTLSTDGSPMSPLDLQKAVSILNSRIRGSNLSAREIMFSRLQHSNENITLNDEKLAKELFDKRTIANKRANEKFKSKPESLEKIPLHSLVFIKQDIAKDKSKIRDLYIVMKVDEDQNELVLQKMLNPITPSKSTINNIKHYRVKIHDVYLAPSQSQLSFTTEPTYVTVTQQTNDSVTIHAKKKSAVKYYSLDDGSEDDIIEGGTTQNQNLQEHPDSIVATTVDANIDYSFVWTEDLSNQTTFSPIFTNQDQEFGVLHMTWDHSSDISTPLYEDFDQDYDDQRNLVHSIVESVLSDELEDDVFEDAADHILNTKVDGNPRNLFNLAKQ